MASLELQWQNQEAVTETIWPAKLKIFIFTEIIFMEIVLFFQIKLAGSALYHPLNFFFLVELGKCARIKSLFL